YGQYISEAKEIEERVLQNEETLQRVFEAYAGNIHDLSQALSELYVIAKETLDSSDRTLATIKEQEDLESLAKHFSDDPEHKH
ncbi:hypothetical protein GOV10_04975, partial [Candidatus Woesearchaeota archaeon]|nr:hypothetical protein [Candidatus Woesearchaeota archaeon]